MKTMIAVLVLGCVGFGMSLTAGQDKPMRVTPEIAAEKPASSARSKRDEDIVTVRGGSQTAVPRALLYPDVAGQTHIIGRLTVNDHAMKQDTRVYSVGLEIDNLSGRAAIVQFDPKDLKLELLDAKGNVVEESATVRTGPAPIAHKATIPTSGYIGISTYRGGIGLTPKSVLLAAGMQAWVVKPGVYRVRGTATVSVDFGAQLLDPEKPDAGNETRRLKLKLIECRFALQREMRNAPDR